MNKNFSKQLLLILIGAFQIAVSQVTDINGRVYGTVKIGEQTWMSENLNVDRFQNGDQILNVKTEREWYQANFSAKPCWNYFANDTIRWNRTDKLYNCYTAIDPRNVCPTGWHVPSLKDWEILLGYLDKDFKPTQNIILSTVAGNKLKKAEDWNGRFNGNNESGFSAVPTGIKVSGGSDGFYDCYFWTSNKNVSIVLEYNKSHILNKVRDCASLLAIRCVRD